MLHVQFNPSIEKIILYEFVACILFVYDQNDAKEQHFVILMVFHGLRVLPTILVVTCFVSTCTSSYVQMNSFVLCMPLLLLHP